MDEISYQADNDYYQLFELPPSATGDDIAKAHKRLAKTCHPDLHPDKEWATERFKEINRAYAVLKDATSKGNYDRLRWEAIGQGASPSQSRRKGPIKAPTHNHDLERERHHKDRLMTYFIFSILGIVMMIFMSLALYRAITKERYYAPDKSTAAEAVTESAPAP